MFIKVTLRIVFLCFFVYLTGCSASQVREIEELKSAPSEISIGGKSYTLEAYIWRDLMPVTDSSVNDGIRASVKIKSSDSSPVPDSLKITKLWIINKDSVWEAKSLSLTRLSPSVLEIFVAQGPSWDKGVMVDAVTEIKLNKSVKLLGIKNQEIQAVY